MLIENGATLDQRDEKSRTPLDKAIEISNAYVVKVLLDCGSPPPTKTSSTLIDELKKRQPTKGRNELVTILVAAGILDESEVHRHDLILPEDAFPRLYLDGGNPREIPADSALELAEMLLDRQCDVDATNKDCDTPLLIAAGADIRSFGHDRAFNGVFWRPE